VVVREEGEAVAKKKQSAPVATQAVGDLIDAHVREGLERVAGGYAHLMKTADFPTGRAILELDRESQAAVVEVLLDRLLEWEGEVAVIDAALEHNQVRGAHPGWRAYWNRGTFLRHVLVALLRRKLPLGEATLLRLLRWPVDSMDEADRHMGSGKFCLPGLTRAAVNFVDANEVSPRVRTALKALIRALRKAYDKDVLKYADRLQALLPVAR
jgi:hypothetical protein